ncbi:MAG: hypothetical protein HYR56_02250 [Acidobacteria bacterium]|nr:hypothetical protein [Acidobacteriota bacterium]MBI3421332.1 hypothetical protein [Acidobacteriota bacterium]
MPAEKIVSQFNKSDLFAVLPPGFVIFTFVYAVYRTNNQTASLWAVLQGLTDQLQQRPAWLVFVLFAAYLLGNLVRTIPVEFAERMLPPFRKKGFPYPDKLQEVIVTLTENAAAARLVDSEQLPDLSNGVPLHVYNYWKNALCVGTANGFDYFQSFETRMRFFTGMLWAGWVGLLGSLVIALRCQTLTHPAGLTMFVLALVILLTFGLNFRRVRRQEARALLLLFVVYQQNSARSASQYAKPLVAVEDD